jgi:hypothetical protein
VTALEQIRRQADEARLQAAVAYQHLADQLAKGEPPPADVLAILQAAGRTPDELEKAVALSAERQRLTPVAESFDRVVRERAEAERKLIAADEKESAALDLAREQAVLRLAPLRAEVERLKEAESQARHARQRLNFLAQRPEQAQRVAAAIDEE